jgi:hypothetical protein
MFQSKNRQLLETLTNEIEHLKDLLVVMDPKVSTSADAYEGLRKTVAAAAASRQAHLVQLAQFSRALRRGATARDLENLVDEWSTQAGLVAVSDPRPDLFENLEGEPSGGEFEVLSPAYVDAHSGRLVSMGEGRWVPRTTDTPSSPDARHTATVDESSSPMDDEATDADDTIEEARA